MYCLVQFIEDNIYYVTDKRNIMKRKSHIHCKWLDRYYYEANLLAVSKNRKLLVDLQNNLENQFPVICLKRHKAFNNQNKICVTHDNQLMGVLEYPHVLNKINENSELRKTICFKNYNMVDVNGSQSPGEELVNKPDLPLLENRSLQDIEKYSDSDNLEYEGAIRKEKENTNQEGDIFIIRSVQGSPNDELSNMLASQTVQEMLALCEDQPEDSAYENSNFELGEVATINNSFAESTQNFAIFEDQVQHNIQESILKSSNSSSEKIAVANNEFDESRSFILESQLQHNSNKKNLNLSVEEVTANTTITDTTIEGCDEEVVRNEVQPSANKTKKNFCIYCKKLISKLPRHLLALHIDKEDVRKLSVLPKGNPEKNKILETIRRQGNFEYNKKTEYNKGFLIACRRPQEKKGRNANDYEYCANCKGLFAKRTLHRHYRKCVPCSKKGNRNILLLGRRIHGKIHPKACNLLKEVIFPVLRDDKVVNIIRYDELLIVYANMLCRKYSSQQNHNMIRAKLRLLGRFLLKIREIDGSVTDFASVFCAKYYDATIAAVNAVALLKQDLLTYKTPTPAFHLGTLLKQSGNVLITEYIKKMDDQKKKEVQDFLKLLEVDYGVSINRTVMESQRELRRSKAIKLPSTEDIRKLCIYLNKNRRAYYTQLKYKFSLEAWKSLAQYTLTTIQVFNRRRAGEIERIKITDFRNYQTVDEKTDYDTYNSLSDAMREKTKKYVRFTIRGKLAREVPVLLHKEYVDCIELLLQERQKAGVSDRNPFVFGLPHTKKGYFNHLSACCLMRKFSSGCGAKNPHLLRGTQLRKHVATQCVLFNLQEHEISDVASFMGHADKIHHNYYRMPIITREITVMSQLLERAQGCDVNMDESDLEEENTALKTRFHQSPSAIETIPARCLKRKQKAELDYTRHVKQRCSSQEETIGQEPSSIIDSHVNPVNNKRISLTDEKTKSLSPFGEIKRLSWTTPEKVKSRKLFQHNIDSELLPSIRYCAEMVALHPELHNRTPSQLYAWVNNQIKAKKARAENVDTPISTHKSRVVIPWSTPEKQVMRESFHENIQLGRLPSLQTCLQVIQKNSDLLIRRTPITVKAWVNNQIKKKGPQM